MLKHTSKKISLILIGSLACDPTYAMALRNVAGSVETVQGSAPTSNSQALTGWAFWFLTQLGRSKSAYETRHEHNLFTPVLSDTAMARAKIIPNAARIRSFLEGLRLDHRLFPINEQDSMIRAAAGFFGAVDPKMKALFLAFANKELKNSPGQKRPMPYYFKTYFDGDLSSVPAEGHADDLGTYADDPHVLVHEFIAFMGQPHKAGLAFEMVYWNWIARLRKTSPDQFAKIPSANDNFQARLRAEGLFNTMTLESVYYRTLADIRAHAAEYQTFGGRRPDLLQVMRGLESRVSPRLKKSQVSKLVIEIAKEIKKAKEDLFTLSEGLSRKLLEASGHTNSKMNRLIISKQLQLKKHGIRVSLLKLMQQWPSIFSWLDEVAETGNAETILIQFEKITVTATFYRKIGPHTLSRPHRWDLAIARTKEFSQGTPKKAWIFTSDEISHVLSDSTLTHSASSPRTTPPGPRLSNPLTKAA